MTQGGLMLTDLFTLLLEDWLFGAIGILAVFAVVVLIAAVFYAGQDVRITATHGGDDQLFPDGAQERRPLAWHPIDRGVPHPHAPFRHTHKHAVLPFVKGRAS